MSELRNKIKSHIILVKNVSQNKNKRTFSACQMDRDQKPKVNSYALCVYYFRKFEIQRESSKLKYVSQIKKISFFP